MSEVNRTIPVIFQRMTDYSSDTRFQKVKIWLMHVGENLNGSYFSKDSIEKAIPSLANTPILGYIEKNDSGEEDFSDHRSNLVREDGKWSLKYAGSAYGVIPENCNPQFENRVCDDGVEREFLTVEGLMWTKWDDPIDIVNRDKVKSQSMEIHTDYTGYFDKKDKLFHFDTFKFFGACFLGIDYNPAMKGSTIETFSYEDALKKAFSDVQLMMEQFKESQRNSNMKNEGGENMEDNKPQVDENTDVPETNTSTPEVTPVETPASNFEAGKQPTTDPIETPASATDTLSTTTTTTLNFGLTNSQLGSELSKALNPNPTVDEWGYNVYEFWYVDADTENMTVVAYDNVTWELVGFSYTMDGDFPVVDFASKKRFKRTYAPMEGGSQGISFMTLYTKEKADHMVNVASKQVEKTFTEAQESMKTQIETLTAQNTELTAFKTTKLTTERKDAEDELFIQFSEQLSDEEISTVREKASEFSLDELQNQLFALVGRKAAKFNVTKKPESTGIKIGVDNGSTVINTSDKPYAALIEEVKASRKN